MNRYSYCRNNPLNATDPSGFDDEDSDGGGDGYEDPGSFWGGLLGGGLGSEIGGFIGDLGDAGFSFSNGSLSFSTFGDLSSGTAFYSASGSISSGSAQFGFQWQGQIQTGDGVYNSAGAAGFSTSWVSISTSATTSAESVSPPASPPVVVPPATESAPAIPSPVAADSGGGWLAATTNVAALLSVIPGPIGDVAGLVNAAGEALQGHWGGVLMGLGMAAAATIGLNAVIGIGREAAKAAPQVEQYALKALEDGFYPVMKRGFKEPQAGIWLDAGNVWKYGTTKNPATRYSQTFLDDWGLFYEKQASGTLQQALSAEKGNIVNFLNQTGKLPPGNKIIR